MGDERALVPTKTVSIELLPDEIIYLRKQQMEVIQKMMQENVHMGLIPGAKKPSLWQPGAQLLDNLHGYAPTFTILKEVEDWDKGFFHYVVNCRMIRRRDNIVVGEGIGSCNSREKKFRESVYHGDDEGTPVDPRDNVNTYLKQASKRAHVTATLNATGLSDLFTVDIEDMADQFGEGGKPDKPKVELCPIHNVPWKKNEKEGKVWYSHKTKDG